MYMSITPDSISVHNADCTVILAVRIKYPILVTTTIMYAA
jgi:hypothetical protein